MLHIILTLLSVFMIIAILAAFHVDSRGLLTKFADFAYTSGQWARRNYEKIF